MKTTSCLTTHQLAFFLGCNIQTKEGINKMRMVDIVTNQVMVENYTATSRNWFSVIEVKPILKPLSRLTNEEVLELGKLACYIPQTYPDCSYKTCNAGNSKGVSFYHTNLIEGEYFSIWHEQKDNGLIETGWFGDKNKYRKWRKADSHHITAFLCELHYDVFGWIWKGLAIKQQKGGES